MIKSILRLLTAGLLVVSALSQGADLNDGAKVFHDRCALCHGATGFGDGLLPMFMGDYPKTALVKAKKAKTLEEIKHVVEVGGTEGGSPNSPPWKDELTEEEIDAVSRLVFLLRENREAAFTILEMTRPPTVPTRAEGRVLFKTYCTRCHGDEGYGDGRMSKVYKNPPPFPLVYSVMPAGYLTKIITNGGASVGRSKVMPSFREQLSTTQIQSVILHLYSIRQLETPRY